MTPGDVKATVAAIRDLANDDEAAHADEDELHQAVLAFIAKGDHLGIVDAVELAREALKTTEIKFSRWYA